MLLGRLFFSNLYSPGGRGKAARNTLFSKVYKMVACWNTDYKDGSRQNSVVSTVRDLEI